MGFFSHFSELVLCLKYWVWEHPLERVPVAHVYSLCRSVLKGETGARGPKCLSKLFWGPNERANISKLCRERAAKADYACSLYTFLANQDDVPSFPLPANYISSISRHK